MQTNGAENGAVFRSKNNDITIQTCGAFRRFFWLYRKEDQKQSTASPDSQSYINLGIYSSVT